MFNIDKSVSALFLVTNRLPFYQQRAFSLERVVGPYDPQCSISIKMIVSNFSLLMDFYNQVRSSSSLLMDFYNQVWSSSSLLSCLSSSCLTYALQIVVATYHI